MSAAATAWQKITNSKLPVGDCCSVRHQSAHHSRTVQRSFVSPGKDTAIETWGQHAKSVSIALKSYPWAAGRSTLHDATLQSAHQTLHVQPSCRQCHGFWPAAVACLCSWCHRSAVRAVSRGNSVFIRCRTQPWLNALHAHASGSVTALEPRQWRAWAVDATDRRPGRLALRSVTLHVAPAVSFTWALPDVSQVCDATLYLETCHRIGPCWAAVQRSGVSG